MNALGCNCSDSVEGVGDFSEIASGIGDFFSEGFGEQLLKAGLSFGVGYGVSQLTAGSRPQQQQAGNLTGGNTVNPAGSGYMPQANVPQQPLVNQQSATGTPSWLLPVAVIGGLAVVALALKK